MCLLVSASPSLCVSVFVRLRVSVFVCLRVCMFVSGTQKLEERTEWERSQLRRKEALSLAPHGPSLIPSSGYSLRHESGTRRHHLSCQGNLQLPNTPELAAWPAGRPPIDGVALCWERALPLRRKQTNSNMSTAGPKMALPNDAKKRAGNEM